MCFLLLVNSLQSCILNIRHPTTTLHEYEHVRVIQVFLASLLPFLGDFASLLGIGFVMMDFVLPAVFHLVLKKPKALSIMCDPKPKTLKALLIQLRGVGLEWSSTEGDHLYNKSMIVTNVLSTQVVRGLHHRLHLHRRGHPWLDCVRARDLHRRQHLQGLTCILARAYISVLLITCCVTA